MLAAAAVATAQEPDPGPEDPPVGADVNDALVVSQNLPDAMYCGDTESFAIRLENVGTGDWTEDGTNGHRLGVTDNDDPFRSNGSKVRLPAGTTIAPGQRHTFTVELTAPETHGVVRTEWQMAEQGVEWFGSIVFKDINVVCGDHAVLAAEVFPAAMNCSSEDEATVTLQNLGSTDWTDAAGFSLANVGTSDAFNPSGAPVRLPSNVTVGRDGGQYPFKVPLQAPSNTHQNDVMTLWQMEHNGEPFGPLVTARIDVDCVNAATRVSDTLPDSMTCGSTLVREVTLRNGGSKPWTAAGGHQLGVPGDTDPFNPSGARVHLPASLAIEENDSHTFDVSLVAPETATTLTTEWQMVENGQWFGEKVSKTITVVCQDAAQAIGHNLPSQMACGEVATYAVTMKNTGDTVWTRADGYKLGPTGGSDPFRADATRVQLPTSASIAPQSQHSFSVALTAPSQPGSYGTEWQMVNEGVGWFGQVVSHPIQVVCGGSTALLDDAFATGVVFPSTLFEGDTGEGLVTVVNNGGTTWTAGEYLLASLDVDPLAAVQEIGITTDLLGYSVPEVPPEASYTFRVPLDPAEGTPGGIYETRWRMRSPDGVFFGDIAEAEVCFNCGGQTGEPRIDSVSQSWVRQGFASSVQVTGANFLGKRPRIAGSLGPGTIEPEISAATASSDGTWMTFHLDTSSGNTEGFHTIVIDADGSSPGAAFVVRVLPHHVPVVDAWTPGEIAQPGFYFFAIVGANLQGATVTSSHPSRVEVVGVNSALDSHVTGLLQLLPGQSASGIHLEVRGRFGQGVLLPVSGGLGASTNLLVSMSQRESSAFSASNFSLNAAGLTHSEPVSSSECGTEILRSATIPTHRNVYPLRLGEAVIDYNVLAGMQLSVEFEMGTMSLGTGGRVAWHVDPGCYPFGPPSVSVEAEVTAHTPGYEPLTCVLTGQPAEGAANCAPGGPRSGKHSQFELTATSATMEITDVTEGDPEGGFAGLRRFVLFMEECDLEDFTPFLELEAAFEDFFGLLTMRDLDWLEARVEECFACQHRGRRNNGCLVGDEPLGDDPLGRYVNHQATDDDEQHSCRDTTHTALAEAARFFVNPTNPGVRPQYGDISLPGGGKFGVSFTHQNGLDIDMRYFSNIEDVFVFGSGPGSYDSTAMVEFLLALDGQQKISRLVAHPASQLKSAMRPYGIQVSYESNIHDNHLHIELVNPSPSKACSN